RWSGKSPQRIALPPPVYSSQPSHMSSFKQSSTLYDSSSFNSKAGSQQSAPPYPGLQMSTGTAPPESSSFDHQVCPICLSNPKDMAFGCGHQTCCECGQDLQLCPICRASIQTRIKLY
ncbi:hypothetical protein MKX03_029827, partial [Papaver bracteatum]